MSNPESNEGTGPDPAAAGAGPSLDDLDSLLASAADLATELAREVGSSGPAVAVAETEAESLSDTGDALSVLDEQLSQVNELTGRAVEEVGAVESASGDTQVLSALQASAASAATEPPALSAADRALLADMDDLTATASSAGAVDPFGAPPSRGGGPVTPLASHASPPAAQPAETPKQPDTPGTVVQASKPDPALSGEPVAPGARGGKVFGLLLAPFRLPARITVAALEAFDSAFTWVPQRMKLLAGWAGISTSVIASAAWVYVLATKPPPIHRADPPPAVEPQEAAVKSEGGESQGAEPAHAKEAAPSKPASSSH